jgi:hypothetical protein
MGHRIARWLRLVLTGAAVAALALAATLVSPAAAQTRVNTALVLLIDVSGSVSNDEYDLQRIGLADAFRDAAVIETIWNSGALAVTVIEWSDQQTIVVPWRLVDSEGAAGALAAEIAGVARTGFGETHVGAAILYGAAQFALCRCNANRLVIDVSGDGISNGGPSADQARDAAVGAGATVNGLAISGPDTADLADWYRANVAGGSGSFVIEAKGFDDFSRAMRQKLSMEIARAGPFGPITTTPLQLAQR